MSAVKLARTQKRLLRKQRVAELEARAAAASDVQSKSFAPHSVHTHARQPTYSHKSFREFLDRRPVLCERSDSEQAYSMADYCTHSLSTMSSVLRVLNYSDTSANVLSGAERGQLRLLRDRWREHLIANAYTLWVPPPASGGVVMSFSLALQLWLLIAHANVVLQLCRSVGELMDFYPPAHEYLVRNQLVVDNARVMQYPLRTLMLALEQFVARLDLLDRLEPAYAHYAVALEHRLSELVCMVGTADEYNAHEWCVPHPDATAQTDCRTGRPIGAPLLTVSTAFLQHTFAYLLTVHWYAERYGAVHAVRVLRDDVSTQPFMSVQSRVPMHVVLQSDWVPSMRSVNHALDFLCRYAHSLVDDNYGKSLRMFLLEFELRPSDLDLYRLLERNNNAFAQSAIEYEFANANRIARTYVNRVYYDRRPYAYVQDHVQWTCGDVHSTRSAPLERQGFVRQLVFVYLVDQFITAKYQVKWRERYLLFHRDAGFITALERARTFAYPIIVQQFARFTVIVPHRHAPDIDVRRVLHWRATVRARQVGATLTTPPPQLPPPALPYRQHSRAYDAPTFVDAFAIWSLWFLVLNDGALDAGTSMKDFLLELFGWDAHE